MYWDTLVAFAPAGFTLPFSSDSIKSNQTRSDLIGSDRIEYDRLG